MSVINENIEQYLKPVKTTTNIEKYLEPVEQEEPSQLGRQAGVVGQEVGSQVLGSFGDIQRIGRSLLSGAAKFTTGKSLEEYEKHYPVLKYLNPKLPTTAELREASNEFFGGKYAPESEGEKKTAGNAGFAAALVTPNPLGKISATRAILSTEAKIGGEAAAEFFGATPEGQETFGLISSIIPQVLSGKINPTEEEAKALYDAGKKLGLSEKHLAPFLTSSKKQSILGGVARQTGKLKDTLTETKTILGESFDAIKANPKMALPLNAKNSSQLTTSLEDILVDLNKTLEPSEDKAKAIKFLESAIGKLKAEGTSGESLVNFWRDLNSFNWKKITGSTKHLEAIKNPILQVIHNIDPKLATQFKDTNALWKKTADFGEKVGWDNLEKYIKLSEGSAFLGAVATGNFSAAGGIVGIEALRRIATRLLSDPNWQNIMRTTSKAIVNRSPKITQMAITQLQNKVKEEFPEDYDEIDWDKLKEQ